MNQPRSVSGTPVLADLGAFFRARRDDITRLWIAAVDRSAEITSSNDLTYRQLLDHLPAICDELADILQKAPGDAAPNPVAPDAATHGRKRWEQGYRLEEVIREVCLLRRNIFDRWVPEFAQKNPGFIGETERAAARIINHFFDEVIVDSTVQFVLENGDHAKRIKRQFLSRMGHDLRTPLSPILLATAALKEDEVLSDSGLGMVDMIVRNTQLEAELIDRLLGEAESDTTL
jgi:signal transduction histidine kinase